MNILYLCDEYPPGRHGGIGTAVQLLAREMVKKGHNVVVAGFYDWGYGEEDEFEDAGVKVFRFRRLLDSKLFRKRDALYVRGLYKLLAKTGVFQYDIGKSLKQYQLFLRNLIREHHIDIVERPDFNEYVQYCTKPTYLHLDELPSVVKIHGTISFINSTQHAGDESPIFEIERDVIFGASAVSSVSRYAAEKTAACFDYRKDITVVHNGVSIVQTPGKQKQNLQVVYAGSLVEKKGVYQLMNAWNIVVEQQPGARLLMLGKGNVGKARSYLSAKASETVIFKGHVAKPELLSDISESIVAVFPSYAETFGLAAAEAMGCGTATLFTNRGAGPEIIRDGIDGLIIDPDDIEDIAEKILRLMTDEELRKIFETNGRRRVMEEFEIGKVAENNISFYSKILEASRNA